MTENPDKSVSGKTPEAGRTSEQTTDVPDGLEIIDTPVEANLGPSVGSDISGTARIENEPNPDSGLSAGSEGNESVAGSHEVPSLDPPEESIQPITITNIQLDNAMAGRNYDVQVPLGTTSHADSVLTDDAKQKLLELGLVASVDGGSPGTLRVEGTILPDSQGDHSVIWDVAEESGSISRLILSLLVNADPKSLWKDIEPAGDLPYRKSHTSTAQLKGDGYKIIAASRRGRSHAHEGTFRDDDFSITMTQSGWDIMIVADGAGSSKFSREGSRLACSTATTFLKNKVTEVLGDDFLTLVEDDQPSLHAAKINHLLYPVLCGGAFAAHKRIQEEADATERNLKEFSTTFLCSIIRRIKTGMFVASFGIGDGAIAVYNGALDEVELMNLPDGGEFSGQTRFLTMRELVGDGAEMMRRIKHRVFENFTILFLMTDGISDPKFGTDNDLLSAEKWRALGEDIMSVVDFSQQNERAAEQLCEWMDFWAQGEHDDRTLAMLY